MIRWLTTSGLRVALILVGALVLVRLATFVTRRVEQAFEDNDPSTMNEREKQAATLGKVIRNLTRILVWGIALMMVLKELGIDIGPILAGIGIMGLAVGFGAQSLVKDFLAGMFVLIENQYNVGDVIQVAGASGLVEKITLRATTLRDYEGNVHIIPNGVIDVLTNKTRQWSRFVLDIGVAYKENVDEVMVVLKEIGDELAADAKFSSMITAPLEVLGVQDFADSAVIIRVMFTTQPVKQWTVGREFRRRVKNTFDAKGIEIPFPHTTIYLGDAAPMDGIVRVKVERDDA
ncbi:mechanosensitive ion channel family protein [bacterium]|nr:mechanosensitive ion channel family protein [bacterium]